jgi:PTS system nitrogen regulatory IIA component
MRLSEMLAAPRIIVDHDGSRVHDKSDALRMIASIIAPVVGSDEDALEQLLGERERLQSTGIGDGVAIPHTFVDEAPGQAAALLLCPHGVPFESIDGVPVNIIFGVVGPKRDTGAHLRALARISRLLRDDVMRERLVATIDSESAFKLIEEREASLK